MRLAAKLTPAAHTPRPKATRPTGFQKFVAPTAKQSQVRTSSIGLAGLRIGIKVSFFCFFFVNNVERGKLNLRNLNIFEWSFRLLKKEKETMEDDQDLKALFRRLDSTIEDKPVPEMEGAFRANVHRFRSPGAKFLEWVVNGGAGMVLIFGAVALSSLFWNGLTFGWLAVPLVVLLVRPLLGDTPVRQPWRMALVLLFGSVLSMMLGTAVDFAVFCYPDRASVLLLSFFAENSLRALLLPDYLLGILLSLALAVLSSRWVARSYPWLERKAPTGSWRLALSGLLLLSVFGGAGYIITRADRVHHRHALEQTLQDPLMKNLEHGAGLAVTGSAIDPESNAVDLSTTDLKYLHNLPPEKRLALASVLVEAFKERRESLTMVDLKAAEDLLSLVAMEEEPSSHLVYTELWWELHCFTQDYFIGREIRPLTREIAFKVALPPLLKDSLSQEEAELWYTRFRSRQGRDLEALRTVVSAHAIMQEIQPDENSHTLENYLRDMEARYLFLRVAYPWGHLNTSDFRVFAERGTDKKFESIRNEVFHRLRYDAGCSILLGVLEARLHHMKHGSYPGRLKTPLADYDYKSSPEETVFTMTTWERKEVLVCRLPR